MTLTIKQVLKLTAPGRYFDQHGLYLQVQSERNRSWLLRYEIRGRERWAGLGPLHTVSLTEARERARKARLQILDGLDPIEQRKAKRVALELETTRSLTFEQAAQQYFNQHSEKWKNAKHRAQFLSTLQAYAFPIIGRLSVSDIDTGLVLQVIEPIWKSKTETASRVRNRIEAVLDWATVRGHRAGENPARWARHLENVLPARSQRYQHHPALPYLEIQSFIALLRQREGIAAKALEFLILCASRTGEVIGATWSEIDFAAKTWTIPAGRMKAKKEHRVPLSDRALEILESLPREDGNSFIFIGPRKNGLSNMAMSTVLRRMERRDITVHGFRSSFRDWAAECTGHANFVVEMALAHTVGNAVEAAYRRGDLLGIRALLMFEWAEFCRKGALKPISNLVPIRRGAEHDGPNQTRLAPIGARAG